MRCLFVVPVVMFIAVACADERAPLPGPAPASESSALRRPPRCSDGLVAPAAGTFATIIEIPSLGGTEASAHDVNDDRIVVGSERAADGPWHAFRYTDVVGLEDLGAKPGFGAQSFATAIASDGAIAGHADHGDGTGALFGYRFTDRTGRVDVCPTVCSAWDLDATGQVVGLVLDAVDATVWQAFLFSPAGGLQRLGTLGGARSSASGITAGGLVVGNAQVPASAAGDVGHAFIWDAARGMRDLNTVSGAAGWVLQSATDATATQIAGFGLRDGAVHPFLYDIGRRGVRDLGILPGDTAAYGFALDTQGDVVGYAVRDVHFNDAFVYSPNFGTRKLADFVDPAEVWDLQQASGMNNRGDIVGWGFHNGQPRGFRVTMPLCQRPRGD